MLFMEQFGTIIMGHVEAYVMLVCTVLMLYRFKDASPSGSDKVLPPYVMLLLCIHHYALHPSAQIPVCFTEFSIKNKEYRELFSSQKMSKEKPD